MPSFQQLALQANNAPTLLHLTRSLHQQIRNRLMASGVGNGKSGLFVNIPNVCIRTAQAHKRSQCENEKTDRKWTHPLVIKARAISK
jgi:hypothetical protein